MANGHESSSTPDRTPTTVSIILIIIIAFIIGGLACITRRGSPLRILREGMHRSTNTASAIVNTAGGLGRSTVHHIPLVAYHARSSRLEDLHASEKENTESEHRQSDPSIQVPRAVFMQHSKLARTPPRSAPGHQSECPICTECLVDGVLLRLLPCGHVFHPACIDPWLERRARTCPLWYSLTEDCWRFWHSRLTVSSQSRKLSGAVSPGILCAPQASIEHHGSVTTVGSPKMLFVESMTSCALCQDGGLLSIRNWVHRDPLSISFCSGSDSWFCIFYTVYFTDKGRISRMRCAVSWRWKYPAAFLGVHITNVLERNPWHIRR